MSEGYILELKEGYNDQTANVFTTEEWFKRLDNGDNCHSDICRLLWERDTARAELAALQDKLSTVTAERDNLDNKLTTAILLCESRKTELEDALEERDRANERALKLAKECDGYLKLLKENDIPIGNNEFLRGA